MKTINIFIWSNYKDECSIVIDYLQKLCKEKYIFTIINDNKNADIIFTNHWKSYDNSLNLNKKIIYWSGESYPNRIIQNNLPYLELNSFITQSNTSFHFPYMIACKYWDKNIRQFNVQKTKFLAFCVSNSNAYPNCKNRINIFNKFCEAFPDEYIEALGSEYGNYKEKHRKIEGYHATINTIQEYSQFKFVLAIENNERKDHIILIDDLRIINVNFPWGETSYGNINFLEEIKTKILSINKDYKFSTLNGHIENDVLIAYI